MTALKATAPVDDEIWESDHGLPSAGTPGNPRPPSDEAAVASTLQRTALGGVFALAAVLYLWALDTSGTVNEYYAQAVAAGSQSWSAMFFGSLDTGNFITVDKPPLSLWVQSASVRLFGFNTWAILVPQVLAGLATVWFTLDAVRRIWGRWAGIVAAATLAVTPVTVAMTRSNLPDPVMILCLVAGAWMLTRALTASARTLPWLLGAFAMVGLGFEAKMLQAWIVLPSFAASYLLFGPRRWSDRLRDTALAGSVTLVVSFAWAIAVELWPGETPWIGGSDTGSVFELIFGYNGLGRIFGEGNGRGGGGAFDDGASWLRMLNADNAHQIAWMLPASLAAIALGAVVARVTGSRLTAAGVTLWGGWTLTHVVVFSGAEGIYHPYYTSALAPGMAALVGAGAVMVWRWRDRRAIVLSTAVVLVASAILAWSLFDRSGWNTWVGPVVVTATVGAGAALVAGTLSDSSRLVRSGLAGGLVALLAAMGVYAGASLVSANSTNGSPSAGPAGTSTFGPGGRAGGSDGLHAGDGQRPFLGSDSGVLAGRPTAPSGAVPPAGATPPAGFVPTDGAGLASSAPTVGRGPDAQAENVEELADWLLDRWDGETWIVAVSGTNVASGITIAGDGAPVMTMGGFNGSDPTPAAPELARYVDDGELRFVMVTGTAGPGGGGETAEVAAERSTWIASTCTPVEDAPTSGLYDCAPDAAT